MENTQTEENVTAIQTATNIERNQTEEKFTTIRTATNIESNQPEENVTVIPSATNIVELPGYESLFKNVQSSILENKLDIGHFQLDNRSSNHLKLYKLGENDRVEVERSVLIKKTQL